MLTRDRLQGASKSTTVSASDTTAAGASFGATTIEVSDPHDVTTLRGRAQAFRCTAFDGV